MTAEPEPSTLTESMSKVGVRPAMVISLTPGCEERACLFSTCALNGSLTGEIANLELEILQISVNLCPGREKGD